MLELSAPFKINICDTHNRKLNRYDNLIADIESKNIKVNYYSLEHQNRLKHFISDINNKYSHIKDNICKVAILASFIIYHSKL